MTLIIAKPTGASLVLSKDQVRSVVSDVDATLYIQAVEAADGQRLEAATCTAINNFVLGCKADRIWSAIKASCILAGARTLTGALVPLVGTAPTNNNFVSGDYNRKTGLVGNGSTKYLNSNRNNNADPQNSKHISVYRTASGSGSRSDIGAGVSSSGDTAHFTSGSTGGEFFTINSFSYDNAIPSTNNEIGLLGASRSASNVVVKRANTKTKTDTTTSQTPLNGNVLIFCRGTTASISSPTNARLAFYSIGESLDLALLGTRVTDLINAFAAAIP